MDQIIHEARIALRSLGRSPGFAAVTVLTLALGIGANTALFSVINTVLLRPLPFADPDRLVTVFHFYPSLGNLEAGMAAPTLFDLEQRSQSFEAVAARVNWGVNVTESGEPERLRGTLVTGKYFAALGVDAALGRAVGPPDAEGEGLDVVVISSGLWQRRFGSDPAVLGSSLRLNGRSYEIVGVMPPGFRDIDPQVELWAPLTFTPAQREARTNEFMMLVARLRPGTTIGQAADDVAAIAEQLKADYPGSYPPDWSLRLRPVPEQLTRSVRPALLVLLGAVGFVLLIACANVANLLLARAAARQRYIAVRAALGARRVALVRQLLVESSILSLLGGAIALLLAAAGTRALLVLQPRGLPRLEEIAIDGTVLLFTLVIALATGLLFGLLPALGATRTDLQTVLRPGGRGSIGDFHGQTARRVLIVSEFALALVLLMGAGLLLRSFASLTDVDQGFDPEGVLTAEVFLPLDEYPTSDSRAAVVERLIERIARIPGVQAAGVTTGIPFGMSGGTRSFFVEGFDPGPGQPNPWGDARVASPGFQETLRTPLLSGRFFTDDDRAGSRLVAVVDQDLANRYWPGAEPLGRRIGYAAGDSIAWMEVVGVIAHTAAESLDAGRRVQVYRPVQQAGPAAFVLAIRTGGDPARLMEPLRRSVQEVDPALPLSQVRTMEAILAEAVGPRRFSMTLLAVFATIAVLLAAVGIYGIVSFEVMRRRPEMGIRLALGADRRSVLALVLAQGLRLAAIGVALGALASLFLTRFLGSQLHGVSARDPITLGAVGVLLLGVAVVATLLPARRATGVDPLTALRNE